MVARAKAYAAFDSFTCSGEGGYPDELKDYDDHGIITYDDNYINPKLNNVFVPIDNLLGKFGTYVYTKSTFDPAPRIFMECKYYNKKIIYLRDKSIQDGGSVYWNREPKTPNIEAIVRAYENII